MRCLLLIALLHACNLQASELWLTVPFTSWHEEEKAYNEDNLGLGLEYKINDNWSLFGVWYPNSYYGITRTNYTKGLGGIYSPSFLQLQFRNLSAKLGLLVGRFTEYGDGVESVVAPSLQFEIKKKVGLDLLLGCPNIRCKDGFIGLSLKFNTEGMFQ